MLGPLAKLLGAVLIVLVAIGLLLALLSALGTALTLAITLGSILLFKVAPLVLLCWIQGNTADPATSTGSRATGNPVDESRPPTRLGFREDARTGYRNRGPPPDRRSYFGMRTRVPTSAFRSSAAELSLAATSTRPSEFTSAARLSDGRSP